MSETSQRPTVLLAATVFVGSSLLFLVQPLLGAYILPWFGGSPAVWTTCMLFFQVMLVAGYGYAFLLSRHPPRTQAAVHVGLLVLSVALLPIAPDPAWAPGPGICPACLAEVLILIPSWAYARAYALRATETTTEQVLPRRLRGHMPGHMPRRPSSYNPKQKARKLRVRAYAQVSIKA